MQENETRYIDDIIDDVMEYRGDTRGSVPTVAS